MNNKDKDFPFDVILYKSGAAFFFGRPIKNTSPILLLNSLFERSAQNVPNKELLKPGSSAAPSTIGHGG